MTNKQRSALLEVRGVGKQREGKFVLKDISFSQQEFQKIAIAGETGSGKSTLLKIIAGLEQPDVGEVLFLNERVQGPDEKLVPGNSAIAYLPQYFELPKFLRVEQVLEYANLIKASEAAKLFKVCEITHLLKRKTNELSGGERQRIALCRLLIGKPKLLLLDEPFSNLDVPLKSTLKSVIKSVSEKLKISCMLVSHDPDDVLPWADQLIVLRHGKIVQQDNPEKIYHQPASTYVAGLFGKFSKLNASQLKRLKQSGKKLFRPENFKIVQKGPHTISGRIEKISFAGGSYEVSIWIGSHSILATTNRRLKEGQKVLVAVKE
jgi:ABC-type Fe3+/spermidine/putrescine transport system ATPase subunit